MVNHRPILFDSHQVLKVRHESLPCDSKFLDVFTEEQSVQVNTGTDHSNVAINEVIQIATFDVRAMFYYFGDGVRTLLALGCSLGKVWIIPVAACVQEREKEHLAEVMTPNMHC